LIGFKKLVLANCRKIFQTMTNQFEQYLDGNISLEMMYNDKGYDKQKPFNQSEVNYRKATAERQCGNCVFFESKTNTCEIVTGNIESDYVCDEHTYKDETYKDLKDSVTPTKVNMNDRYQVLNPVGDLDEDTVVKIKHVDVSGNTVEFDNGQSISLDEFMNAVKQDYIKFLK
jgi:hypothetical protein